VPVEEGYGTICALSTKNATKLPKCSKTLHFRTTTQQPYRFCGTEEKTNKELEINRVLMDLRPFIWF